MPEGCPHPFFADLESCLVCERDEALAEVRRLKAALRRYGQHSDTCGRAHYEGNVPCRCGLDAALEGGE
jgi:hypothetical protein